MTSSGYWPLTGLRLHTEGLELRLPDADDLLALAALAEAGVHDPATQPFEAEWTDVSPPERALATLRYHWSCWGSWQPTDWTLNLVAVRDGTVVGMQGMSGANFAKLREVGTGSWLGLDYQGQGIGTAMRAAVLALAFDGLGAEFAISAAFVGNPASIAVSRKLGYAADGMNRYLIRGEPVQNRRFRLDRAAWLGNRRIDVSISGLEPCLPLFGLNERDDRPQNIARNRICYGVRFCS
jgi:RimJ/RimL family protein N-acetyltransferase